jgi:5'-nucleotidase
MVTGWAARMGAAGRESRMALLLVTNDDGIDAPGILALRTAAARVGEPVVVAPVDALSGCSHRVTTHVPLRATSRPPYGYAVDGTPADCVRLGLHHLAPEAAWVLSGINAGGNLGADVYVSGTVAAVREAVLHGRPGIAFSQYLKRGLPIDWERSAAWAATVLSALLTQPCAPGAYWNVNLPHLGPDAPEPEVVFCPLDSAPLPVRFRQEGDLWHYDGNYHGRVRSEGSDIDVCFSGRIAVTKLTLY